MSSDVLFVLDAFVAEGLFRIVCTEVPTFQVQLHRVSYEPPTNNLPPTVVPHSM